MNRTISDYQQDSLQKKLKKILQGLEGVVSVCPIRNILDRFGDKWSMLSIFHLGEAGTLRYNELKKRIDGILQRMLTVTLQTLERDGLVTRRIFAKILPRIEHKLTDLGHSLLLQIIELGDWASNHSAQILKARKQYATREQAGFKAGL